jgi:hypothetical protein
MNKQSNSLRLELLTKIRTELTELIQSLDYHRTSKRLSLLARGFSKVTKSYTTAEYVKHAGNLADALLMSLDQHLSDKTLDDETKVY